MKYFYTILTIMILASSCKTSTDMGTIELENQQIGITSVHNARQLGGYVIGNKKVRQDVLLRTARLSTLSQEDSLLLAETFKVQCIYDFRGQQEAQDAPDVIPGNSRHELLSISFSNDQSSSAFKTESEREMIQLLLQHADHPMIQAMCDKMYDKIFFEEASQEVYRRFFADLITIDPSEGAVLWHCTQGKDRAGSASAMILAALGADRDLIMADFKLSKEYYDPHLANIPAETPEQKNVVSTLLSVNPELFERTLDKVDELYGSFTNYLTECLGVTPEMMNILRERYLE